MASQKCLWSTLVKTQSCCSVSFLREAVFEEVHMVNVHLYRAWKWLSDLAEDQLTVHCKMAGSRKAWVLELTFQKHLQWKYNVGHAVGLHWVGQAMGVEIAGARQLVAVRVAVWGRLCLVLIFCGFPWVGEESHSISLMHFPSHAVRLAAVVFLSKWPVTIKTWHISDNETPFLPVDIAKSWIVIKSLPYYFRGMFNLVAEQPACIALTAPVARTESWGGQQWNGEQELSSPHPPVKPSKGSKSVLWLIRFPHT